MQNSHSKHKKLSILLLSILWITNLPLTFAATGFTDLTPDNKNYEAIMALQENGTLNGYEDGSFKPDQKVNRAEFLKIIIKGSKIPLDTDTPTAFSDVDNEAWFAPYVRKAFSEGWITGYTDGTFKPEQTITKVEAIKIIGKAQKWSLPSEIIEAPYPDVPLDAWYTPYISFAKEHQFLEGGTNLDPTAKMTRGSISQVIYNSQSPAANTDTNKTDVLPPIKTDATPQTTTPQPATQPKIKQAPVTDPDFTPVNYGEVSSNFYDNITLDEAIPNTFYKNEVYVISGKLINPGTYKTVTVILDPEADSINQSFSADLVNNHFDIPVHFRKAGNYILGLIPGDNGQSKGIKISIHVDIPGVSSSANPPTPASDLNIKFSNDKTSISFKTPDPTIKKLYFTQNYDTVAYISRQTNSTLSINYADFINFSEGEVSYHLETAYLQSQKPLIIESSYAIGETKKFTAVEHTYDLITKDSISTTPPDTLSNLSQISLSGTLKTDTKIDALVTKPDGFVDTITLTSSSTPDTYFTQKFFKANSDFLLNYKTSTNGRYIVEINNKNSEPILNHPIYVGEHIPLIPDFFDTNARSSFDSTLNITQARQDLFNLINKDRVKYGLSPIILSDELNSLSQNHSDDMVQNNFFSHYNPQNQTPEDRRTAAGIKTPVGENLAKDTSVSFAHYGLMRSGSHRNNILNPDWTRVGIGITKTTDDYLVFTEEFSTSEITADNLIQYKNQLLTEINKKRTDISKAALGVYADLDNASKYLNDKVVLNNATLSNSDLSDAIDQFNINGNSQLLGRSGNSWKVILDSIIEDESSVLDNTWELIGIDIQINKTGTLNAILILNSQQ